MVDSLGFHFEMTQFSGAAPIFPLPDTVFFPKTLLPLQIFEPRYREMTRDVLQGERIICITLLQTGWEDQYYEDPPIHSVGTLGYIEEVEQLDDGKYDILLNGLARVDITELERPTLYRQGEMRILEELEAGGNADSEREQLMERFRKIARLTGDVLPLQELEEADVSLEMLVNLLSTWLPIPTPEKQKLLEVNNILHRSEIVREYLRQELGEMGFLEDLDVIVPDDPRWN